MSVADLTWAVGQLAELSTHEFDVDELLRRLCEVAARSLSADGVGVMKTDENNATRFVHASTSPLVGPERLQETLQQGPCRDSIDTGEMVVAATTADMPWPALRKAVEEIGMQAVLAVPMISRGRTFGTLDLYWRTEHLASADDRAAAKLLADVAVSYLVMTQDRAETRRAQAQLVHRSLHDPLTGVPNRNLMQELIEHALSSSDRKGTLVAVLFIDVDRFKPVNDTYGHQAGDEVLQILAHRMQAAVRSGDVVGRMSGDEFLVLCDDLANALDPVQDLNRVGQRIRRQIAEPVHLAGVEPAIEVTASIGIAFTGGHPRAAELIRTADLAMYEAKTMGGRNHVVTVEHP